MDRARRPFDFIGAPFGAPFSWAVIRLLAVREILEIACRYTTSMATAMVDACMAAMGVCAAKVRVVDDAGVVREVAGEEDAIDPYWDRMVRTNSDTRENHC